MIGRLGILPSWCHRWLAAGAAALLTAGCHHDVVPVSGRVTLNGQPLAGAVVTFQPMADRNSPRPPATGSVGHTDTQGRFSLRLIEPNQLGAAVGDHTVTISTAKGGSDAEPAKGERLPKAWRDGSKRFRVPLSGTSQADFNISAP